MVKLAALILILIFNQLSKINAQNLSQNFTIKAVSVEELKSNYILELSLRLTSENTFEFTYKPDLRGIFDHFSKNSKGKYEICGTALQESLNDTTRIGNFESRGDSIFLKSSELFYLIPERSEYALNFDSLLAEQNMIKIRNEKSDSFKVINTSKIKFINEHKSTNHDYEIFTNDQVFILNHLIEFEEDETLFYSGTPNYFFLDMPIGYDVAMISMIGEKYYLEFNNIGFQTKIQVEFKN